VPDIRKVRHVAPLDAMQRSVNGQTGWHVGIPGDPDCDIETDGYWFWNAEFAAAFMPAELLDAVLDAARVVGHAWLVWDASPSGTDEEDDAETALLDAAQNAYVAVRAYDAHRQDT